MRYRMIFVVCCLVLMVPVASVLAATINIVAVGGGKYQVVGSGFSGAAALDLWVKYDPASLSAPLVTQGVLANGTLFAANPNRGPGVIQLAFVHASGVSGSGPVAEISFTLKGGSGAPPSISSASLYDTNGKAISLTSGGSVSDSPASGIVVQPVSKEPLWTGGTGTIEQAGNKGTTTTTATGGAVGGGTITLPGDPFGGVTSAKDPGRSPVSDQPPPPMPPPSELESRSTQAAATTPPPVKERRKLPASPASVLERFRTYKGETTVAAMKPLFTLPGGGWVVQEPAIALADGKATLTVQITLDQVGLDAPNFALRGLEMTALKTVGESGWLIEAIPAAGAFKGSISLLLDDAAAELPVLVVPPLPKSWADKKLTEAEVNKFLAERGTAKGPAGDLNNDGLRDYRDDYIMIGNYLLATVPVKEKEKVVAPPAKADKSETQPVKGSGGKEGVAAKP